MKFPSARTVIVGVIISLAALWAYNNVEAVRKVVGPRT